MKKNYEAFIFDLDGTLIDSKKDIAMATNETIAHMGGKRLPEERVASFVGHGVSELIRDALKDSKSHGKEMEALRFFMNYYLEHCLEHTKLYHGAERLLRDAFYQGIKLAVLTNKPQVYTDNILKGLGVDYLFTSVIGAEAGYAHKPSTEGARAIFEKLDVKPEKVLMVGDSLVDLQTAEHAGMDCALALNGFSDRDEILSYKGRAKILYEEIGELSVLLEK